MSKVGSLEYVSVVDASGTPIVAVQTDPESNSARKRVSSSNASLRQAQGPYQACVKRTQHATTTMGTTTGRVHRL